MKKVLTYLCLSSIFISCSHRINRIGYSVKKSEHWDCDLPIKKDFTTDTAYKKTGEIQFRECKHSKIKTEEDVISIIKKDGCAIDAEFAVIKKENNPSIENACYQCNAEYYVKKTTVVNSPDFKMTDSEQGRDHKEIALLSVLTGIAILLIFLHSYAHLF